MGANYYMYIVLLFGLVGITRNNMHASHIQPHGIHSHELFTIHAN